MDAPHRKTQPRATRGAGGATVAMTLTNRARNAALTLAQYISGTWPTVSAEDADEAGRTLFEELDKLETIVRALIKARVVDFVIGFLMGALLVITAMIGGRSHP